MYIRAPVITGSISVPNSLPYSRSRYIRICNFNFYMSRLPQDKYWFFPLAFGLMLYTLVPASGLCSETDLRHVPGIYGGEVHAICSPAPDVLIVASDRGVYRTSDSCKSWQYCEFPVNINVRTLACSPGGAVYAGVEGSATTLYTSVDGGVHWQGVSPVEDFGTINTLLCGREGSILIGSEKGLYRRHSYPQKGGSAFERIFSSEQVQAILVDDGRDQIVIGTRRGIYKSSRIKISW
jgi:hypothetical protein